MHPLTTTELLAIWEAGRQQTPLERSLYLLAAYTDSSPGHVATLSVGQRDALLLQIREGLFGSRLLNKATCPACAEPIEWETRLADLRLQDPQANAAAQHFTLSEAGFTIQFRLPTSQDIYRTTSEPAINANQLLADCIMDVKHEGNACPVDTLPESILASLNQRMEAEDPQANIEMQLNCPACRHPWTMQFDVVSYLWAEVDSWAPRMFQDVYVLARAFGWSERDILTMSSQRRQIYLDMVGV